MNTERISKEGSPDTGGKCSVPDSYDQKFQRFRDVLAGKLPDRVPVLPNIETWMFHHTGIGIREAFTENADALFEAFRLLNEELYLDGVLSISNTFPLKMGSLFGNALYQVSDRGVQIVGSKGKTMEAEEYGALAADPLAFFANELAPRRFTELRGSLEEKVSILKQSFYALGGFNRYNGGVIARIEKELGLPVLVKGTNYLSPDVVLDYLRDFAGVSRDVRRCPDAMFEACEAIYEMIMDMFYDTCQPPDGRVIFSPLHLPTYLRPKDFERLYLPFMKRYIKDMAIDRGYQLYFFMEGDWMPYLDLLQELPEGAQLIGLFEGGDARQIKERMRGRMIFMGGMPLSVLSMGTKEEAVDKAKECLETLAPGGGYIFSTDKVLLSPNDARAENLIAVCEYVHENGKY